MAARAENPDQCHAERSDLRDHATKLLGLPPDTDISDRGRMWEMVRGRCGRNMNAPANAGKKKTPQQGPSTGPAGGAPMGATAEKVRQTGICQGTYVEILKLIKNADSKVTEACLDMKEARKKAEQCNQGEDGCYLKAAELYRQAKGSLIEAKDLMRAAEKNLREQLEQHKQVAKNYASHLRTIAEVIAETDKKTMECALAQSAGGSSCVVMSLTTRRQVINDEVRARLAPDILATEGNVTVDELLKASGVSQEPAAIRARAVHIELAAEDATKVPDGVQYGQQYGEWAGPQIQARQTAYQFIPLTEQGSQKLDAGVNALEAAAKKLEGSISHAGSIPNGQRLQTQPPAVRPQTGLNNGVPVQIASAAPLLANAGGLNLSGASRAPAAGTLASAGAVEAPQGTGQLQVSRTEPARGGRGLGLAPGEGAKLASAVGRELSTKERELDEIRGSGQFADALEPQGPAVSVQSGDSAWPHGFTTSASRAAPLGVSLDLGGASGRSASANRAPAQEKGSDDPNAQAYADRQLERLEQGRSFSPGLRDLLKKRLISDYARGSGNAKAAAALFEEMRRSGGFPEAAAISVEEQQMGILSSQSESLFDRVRSCHRRSLSKAKLSFF